MDFYPSFPPIVTITRPRLMGSMLSRVSTLRELHVDHWNSVGGMKKVLQAIHKILQSGTVDWTSPLCSPANDTDTAYSQLELYLLKLSAITGIPPRIVTREGRYGGPAISEDSVTGTAPGSSEGEDDLRDAASGQKNEGREVSRDSSGRASKRPFGEAGGLGSISSADESGRALSLTLSPEKDVVMKSDGSKGHGILSRLANVFTLGGKEKRAKLTEDKRQRGGKAGRGKMEKGSGQTPVALHLPQSDPKLPGGGGKAVQGNSNPPLASNEPPEKSAATSGYFNKLLAGGDMKHPYGDGDWEGGDGGTIVATVAGAKPTTTYWAQGTGYGTGGQSSKAQWNMNDYMAAQAERGRQQCALLTQVLDMLRREVSLRTEPRPGLDTDPTVKESHWSHVAALDSEQTRAYPGEVSLDSVVTAVSDSCLLPILEELLRNESLLDMDRNIGSYCICFQLLELFVECQALNALLLPLPGQGKSLAELSVGLQARMEIFNKKLNITEASDVRSGGAWTGDIDLDRDLLHRNYLIIRAVAALHKANSSSISLESEAQESGSVSASPGPSSEQVKKVAEDTPSLPSSLYVERDYIASMSALQYEDADFLKEFTFADKQGTGAPRKKAWAKRLAQEHADWSHSLPCSWSSSVWMRCCTDRMDAIRFVISGPRDTPYSNGLFVFDAWFPPEYPSSPPKVTLLTTGGGTVRFNPNLYNNGKVLVSIQSFILVPQPYFNEPGFEQQIGTVTGAASSLEYNWVIRLATVRWAMIENLRHPVVGFKEVVETHFKLKRTEILTQIDNWIAESKVGSSRHTEGRTLLSYREQFVTLLEGISSQAN
eukprot:gene1216-1379_t